MERQGDEREVRPHAPHPPPSDARRAGAQAAEDHLGPSSEGDTAPETAAAAERSGALYQSHIPPGFSLVVDDVDADEAEEELRIGPAHDQAPAESGFGVEVVVALECERPDESACDESCTSEGEACRQGTLTHSSSQKELSDARIKQIQGEVESRKNEFARLLEEHAQVVKQLKAMEEVDGGERLGRRQLH